MGKASKYDIPPLPTGIANHWKGKVTTREFGRERLRFWWLDAGKRVPLDGWAESFSWDDMADGAPVVTGSLSMRQSLSHSPIPPMRAADVVLCEMQPTPDAAWRELTRLRISEPQKVATGQFTYQLANDASLLLLSKDNWRFPHDKAHKKGWAAWQIVAEVCKRCRIRVVMPKVGKPIKKFPPMLNASAIDVINKALDILRKAEKKPLVRRFENGTLYLSQRHYSPELLALGPALIDASLTEQRREDFATALTLRTTAEVKGEKDARGKKKATHKGIKVELERPAFTKRYGYVHAILYAHGASSAAEVRALGLYHLARVLQPRRTLSITSPFIPGLRRGGYIRMAIPALGLTQIVYVHSVSYQAGAGSITMEVTCGFDDPQITPPVDRVNASTRGLAKKKKANPKPPGSKTDAKTAKPPSKRVHVLAGTGVDEANP